MKLPLYFARSGEGAEGNRFVPLEIARLVIRPRSRELLLTCPSACQANDFVSCMACFAKCQAQQGSFRADQDTALTLHLLQTFALVSSANLRS